MKMMKTIKKLVLAAVVAGMGLCGTAWAQEAAAAVEEAQPTVETTYFAWDKDTRKVTGPHVVQAIPLTGHNTTVLEDGKWYVVQKDEKTGEVQLPTLIVSGEAHLILEDGVKARVNATEKERPGIWLETPESVWDTVKSSISIYGQAEGTGRLRVDGDAAAAAIGTVGGAYAVGTVNIHGGQIEAYGGAGGGAAIGTGAEAVGCFEGYPELPCTFAVNIYGGTVLADAHSGFGGPGIGFGHQSDNPHFAMAVWGGEVTALGSESCGYVSAIGLGMECQKHFADPQVIDYFKFTLGRGMGLWTGKNKDTSEDESRMTAAEYDVRAIQNAKLPYAHIKPAPVTKVTVRVSQPEHTSYALSTNGVPVIEGVTSGEETYELPGAVEVEVAYTADAEYEFGERKKTWTKFIGAQDIEGASEFVVEPPPAGMASPEVSLVKAIPFLANRQRIVVGGDMHNSRRICRLELKDPARTEGASYFWVSFKDLNSSDFKPEEAEVIRSDRRKLDELFRQSGVGQPVGRIDDSFKKEFGSSVAEECSDNAKYYCETGTVTDVGAEPFVVELPGDTEAIYIFKFADNKTSAVGGNAHVLTTVIDTYDIWVNELVGETVVQPYYAWDAQQGKTVLQPPIEATVIKSANETAVLHPGKWYVVVGEVDLPGLRVDVGTAHVILAEGAQLFVCGDVTVDDDATLAVYSGIEPRQDRWCKGQTYFVSNSEQGYMAEAKGGLSGGTLAVHGGCFACKSGKGPAIRNRRTEIYDGVVWVQGAEVDGSVICSRTIDVVGGHLEGWADYGDMPYWSGYPLNVVAGEQDGDVCTLKVHVGGVVDLDNGGVGQGGEEGDYSAIGKALDVRLDDGVYVWSGSNGSERKLTSIPIYRARPKNDLVICSSAETIKVQDFGVTAVYDENLKTNGFTLKLPEGDLRPGEKWFVFGIGEQITRLEVEKGVPMTVADYLQLEFEMMTTELETNIVGVDFFARYSIESGFGEIASTLDFTLVTDESTIEIPASAAVDLILLGRAYDTPDLPVIAFGMAKDIQSLRNGETAGNSFEFITKQELSVDPVGDGTFALTMPEGDELKDGESWTWISFPEGIGDNDEYVGEIFGAYGSMQIPVGLMSFELFFSELGGFSNGHGSTTDQTIALPEGTAAVIVGKTRAGFTMEDGPTEWLLLTLGGASHLNVPDYAAWPRHDEIFPTDADYCTVKIPENDKAALTVFVGGQEVGYRPDGIYKVRKGSDVVVRVMLVDPEHYELRCPAAFTYSNIQADVEVKAEDIAVVERSEASPVADQGFAVRRGADGALTLDLSGEAPLASGEKWAYAALDKSCYDMLFTESMMSFGDYLWDMLQTTVDGARVGELTLDNYLTLAGAEAMGVTTESTVALPHDAELVFVGRVYDGFSGQLGTPRYYALSLGGARHLTKLAPGAESAGERWHAARQVRYSAWDGKKVAFGATATAQPLTLDSFAAEELVDDAYVRATLHVTSDAFYTAAGVLRDEDDRKLVIDVAPGVTLSLLVEDGAQIELARIHLPATATLNVYGQVSGSGTLALNGEDVPASVIGGYYEEGCGTINVYGGVIGVRDIRGGSKTTAIGSCDGAGANGSLNVYGGFIYVMSKGVVAIGGQQVLPVNVYGGKIVVANGKIGTLNGDRSGLNLGAGYKLMRSTEINELVEISVEDYEKQMAAGDAPTDVQIVRPAAITFDAQIAGLVNAGQLVVQIRSYVGTNNKIVGEANKSNLPDWTGEGGTYRLDCGDSALIVFSVRDASSLRVPDILRFPNITGDIAVTLDDLRHHAPELVAEQPFEVLHCADGRFRLTPQGELADGEAWLWIALPNAVATRDFPDTEGTVEDYFAQRFQDLLASKALYVGGMFTGGGKSVFTPEARPIYNCVQTGLSPQNPFLPMDGFHWGVSREKSVFYAPSDTEFAAVFKVYDAGVGQLLITPSKASVEEAQAAPAEAEQSAAAEEAQAAPAAKKAAALQGKASGVNMKAEVFLVAGCRYTSVTAGAKTQLQALPLEPELLPGGVGNPWKIGVDGAQEPVAYTNDTETLVIEGEGPFAVPTKKPWLGEGVGPIAEIVIRNPETELPDDIFEGLGTPDNPIGIDLPDGWPADDLPVPGQPWHGGYVKIEDGHWPLTVSNVKFQQRYPWNGLVDVTFDLTGSTNVELGVWAKSGATTVAASNFVGRTDMKFAVEGKKTVKLVWDADADCFAEGLVRIVRDNVTITVGTGGGVGGERLVNARQLYSGSHELGTHAFQCPVGKVGLAEGDELILKLEMSPIAKTFELKQRCVFLEGLDDVQEKTLENADIANFDKGDGYYSIPLAGRSVGSTLVLSGNGVLIKEALLGRLVGGTSVDVGAVSATGVIDLAKGTRVAREIENIVIDPAWGAAATASVLWPKAETPKAYAAATVDKWDVARLPAGKYEFAYTAGSTDYTAAFWVPANNWTVIDHETITGERPVTGEKVLVTGETVIQPGGKLVIEGDPEIIWDGAFKVEKGGKIYAPYFNVVVDPETGLVTLEPKDRPTVTGLRFAQRYPWNGLVDVFFTATYAADPTAKVWVKLAAKLEGDEKPVKTLYLANDPATTNTQFQVAQGEVHLIWDTMKDVGLENFGNLEITALAALIRMAEEDQPEEPAEDIKLLCLTARGGSVDIFLYSALFDTKSPYYPDLEYSKDGKTWTKYDPQKTKAIQLMEGESVYLRGNNPNGWNPNDLMQRASDAGVSGLDACLKFKMKWSSGVTVEASGSVMSLIDGKGAAKEIPNPYCFAGLFADCSCLTKAPDLTATTVKDSCYLDMFKDTKVTKITVLATGDPSLFEDTIQDVVADIELEKSGTLVVDPCWRDFGIPSSYKNWYFKFTDEGEPVSGAVEPLCFTPTDGGGSIQIGFVGTYEGKEGPNIQYSFDGEKWMACDPISGESIKCGSAERIYLRGKNPNGLTTNPKAGYVHIYSDRPFEVSGNVMSLIDYEKEVTEIPCAYCFYHLFEKAEICTAPELPATVLKPHCYEGMFMVTRLTAGPTLPAPMVPEYAYAQMFEGCGMLESLRFEGVKVATADCFSQWLDGVASKGDIYSTQSTSLDILGSLNAKPEGWALQLLKKPMPKAEAK